MKKIIVAHPGKQHSFQTAIALKESGMLFQYVTTLYDKKYSLLYFLKFFLRGKAFRKAFSRKTAELDDSDVTLFCSLGGLSIILLSRLHINRKYRDILYRLVHKTFAKKVAYYALKNNVDAVIMYDSNVYDAFDILKAKNPSIKCILDTSIAARSYMKQIYIKDLERYPHSKLKKEQSFLWNSKLLEGFDKEFRDADYCFVGSDFVKQSVISLVKNKSNVFIIPYGVNLQQFKNGVRNFEETPLQLLFVGGVILRKGIHHLLNVVSQYSEKEVFLNLVGAFNPNDELYKNFHNKPNICFHGFVTRDQIAQMYTHSHLFVLPSLAEGMAMVGLEALASGLPVLCTYNTGLSSIVKDGYNGFCIPASDEEELQVKIDWFLKNKEKMPLMSKNAENSVYGYSWEDYRKKVSQTLKEIFCK